MTWEAVPSGRRGRQQACSNAAIQACLTFKILFGLPLRQSTGFVASLLKLVGLDWTAPDFSTLCRRQKTLSVAIPCKGSTGQLHLLVDSTGTKAEGEGEWNAHAVIPPRKNAKFWKPETPGARARNEAVRSSKYLGRALWRQVTGYHRRSRVETKPLGIMLRITLPVSGCIV
jgi:hypothetical protein